MECPTCGDEFDSEQGVRIHHGMAHDDPLPNRTCADCGVEFYDSGCRRTYCDDCHTLAGADLDGSAKETTACERCGDEFEYYPSNKEGVYCSTCVEEADDFLGDPYRPDGESVEVTCEQCDESMIVYESTLEQGYGRFCSRECHGQWMSENRTGENHHQWTGGGENYDGKWWRVRREALDRDDHTCQNCGRHRDELGQEPDVHHITPVRTFDDPQDAHHRSNVITLCRRCHRHVEAANIPVPDRHVTTDGCRGEPPYFDPGFYKPAMDTLY
jgi:5-methylcytosine-specific restriction endonuclease McrA